jgi:hypothetical protein
VEAASPAAVEPGRDAKDTVLMDAAINSGFVAWSSAWQVDRYTPGSAHIAEKDCSATGCKVQGSFKFARFGAVRTIPFSAVLERAGASGFSVTRLCYDDPSSGMRDCVGAQR